MFEQKILSFDECKMRIDTNYRRCPVFLEMLEGFIREKLRDRMSTCKNNRLKSPIDSTGDKKSRGDTWVPGIVCFPACFRCYTRLNPETCSRGREIQ